MVAPEREKRDLLLNFFSIINTPANKSQCRTSVRGRNHRSDEVAAGKPLELVSGSNLLDLLKEKAGIEAKIEMPESWKDLQLES